MNRRARLEALLSFVFLLGLIVFVLSCLPVAWPQQIPVVNRNGVQMYAPDKPFETFTTIYDVGAVPAADTGAQINAAVAALGSSQYTLVVKQSGSISGAVNLGQYHDLVCSNTNIVLTLTTAASQIAQSSHSHIRHCQIVSARTDGISSIQAISQTDISAEDLIFSGGYQPLSYLFDSNVLVDNVRVTGVPTTAGAGYIVVCYGCTHAKLRNVAVGPAISGPVGSWVLPASFQSINAISVTQSSDVEIENPTVRYIDGSTVPNLAGVDFSAATNSSLTGGIVTGLANGDGVVVEHFSSGITISGTQSYGNNPVAAGFTPAGSYNNNGDGFDIYQSTNVQLSGCNASGNGAWQNIHMNVEIFLSSDVQVSNCNASGGGNNGVWIVSSPNTKVANVKGDGNYAYGSQVTGYTTNTCTTAGTAVTMVTGIVGDWQPGTPITINSVQYVIASINFASPGVLATVQITLQSSAGTQASPVACAVESANVQISNSSFSNNGVGPGNTGIGTNLNNSGLAIGNAATATVVGVTTSDTNASGLTTQKYGINVANTAVVSIIGGTSLGNGTLPYLVNSTTTLIPAPKLYTVATLPAASSLPPGTQLPVSDATTYTPGTLTGGGSDYMLAVTNGSAWTAH